MKNCRICIYIRYFLAFVLLIIIIALTFDEELEYLSFITPWNAAILVFITGICIFLYKLLEYFKQKD